MYKWELGEYPRWFMARTIAWYRGHLLIKNHTQDALASSIKKKKK